MTEQPKLLDRRKPIEGIKKIIAVAAGKGGVGKSTASVGLALALAASGKRIGLLDADIHGPSIPRMMGISGKPEIENNRIIPFEKYGVKCASWGFFMEEDSPAIWRGPMIGKALHELFRGVKWGELDILVVDMPPGTGDIALSLAQNYPVSGVVIISTPQEVALSDVRKCVAMFRKLEIPILGMVENMSYFLDASGNKIFIFGEHGARNMAGSLALPFLGEIPINPALSSCLDSGHPQAAGEAFKEIAEELS